MSAIIKKLDKYVPIDRIFSVYADETYAVFLDSSLQNELGQYSIIGINPYHKVVNGQDLEVNGSVVDMKFEDYMYKYLEENYEENNSELPLVSGAIGYLSYDYGMKLENVESVHIEENGIPYCVFCFYDDFIIEDHRNKEIYLISNGKNISSDDAIRNMERTVLNLEELDMTCQSNEKEDTFLRVDPKRPNDGSLVNISSDFTKEEYLETIKKLINYIVEGDIYVANLTQRLEVLSKKKPYEVFVKLRSINPSPFGGYLNYKDFQIVCSSPERFMRMKDRIVETRPIKGTRKKCSDQEENQVMKEELKNSDKDKSELLMIVDLERNDLNRVCEPGSVRVNELFEIEEYATVYHLVSGIEGRLKEEYNSVDLIKAAFPGGSITGAPKKRAIEIIDELENGKRGIYTGSIGYLSLDGSCDLNIVIRTAVYNDGKYTLGVGGGITYESDAVSEFEETLQKAKAVLEAMD